VWAADITYIQVGRGFFYLVAIMDWASRAVLAWRLSNTMDVSFCVDALKEALTRFGRPEIFNTDRHPVLRLSAGMRPLKRLPGITAGTSISNITGQPGISH
jgi:transposase InsO family protein